MKETRPSLGPLGSNFFAYMQVKGKELVRLGELQEPLGLSAFQEQKLLQRLADKGYLIRLKRGVYLVPQKIPPGGFLRPSEYYVIAKYMEVQNAKYYVSGLAAFNYHGLSHQIANQYVVYNNKISGLKNIDQIAIRFIKTSEKNITGTHLITIKNINVPIASLEKSVLDVINDWQRYQILAKAYEWLKKYKKNKKFINEFIRLTLLCANNNAIRRIGYYLEKLGVNKQKLSPLLKKLNSIQSWIILIPKQQQKGKTNNKWRIIDNVK